jgi:glutathione S-transferase
VVYELFYWPTIQGRGEFIRLALEEAGAEYVDVARREGGMKTLLTALEVEEYPSFAPPFLKADELTIGQVANILLYLGEQLGLAPHLGQGRLWTNQLQLTIADLVSEVHDTHHPISSSLYYEDQKPEAKRRAADFIDTRLPKYLGYFERILANPHPRAWLVGEKLTYVDLSMFQVIEGLRYAFPKAMARIEPEYPNLLTLRDRVAARPNIAAYLASERRIPFNQHGIFRHYRELDK